MVCNKNKPIKPEDQETQEDEERTEELRRENEA